MLYQKWSERVFAPIQQGLASQMGGSGCRELDRKKRQLFGHYLSYQNRKVRFYLEPHEVVCTQFMYNSIPCMQTIFLDTISSEEYDPLLLTCGREKLKVRLHPIMECTHNALTPVCTHIAFTSHPHPPHILHTHPTPTHAHRSLQAALMTPSSLRQWTMPMRRG